MRLGKKTKDDDQRIEFVDGLVKIICKTSKASTHSNGSHPSNAAENNSSANRFQSPIKSESSLYLAKPDLVVQS